ncbi:RES family NAD+ phosphorylase [Anaeromyxobacter sp. PSR-1]|uniref:RES family NAD+ phosphorylase n=1 Tax=Anaeromyxobacter sp. PSR-1 TaxID=1300915 RepID=UPI0005E1DAE9|nr:RES family NAD+ phosphorylase [Anaeromyxobacter sp. PSR-1]GAO01314.1 RES domain protein [Anaeromyxobacter sp. PSR-1]
MKAWRLSRFDSQQRTFDGEGARLFPGRWNPAGVPVVYASEHLSLAVLEVLVHARADQVRITFHAFEITIPDVLVEVVRDEQLPRSWDGAAIARATRELGDTWARERRSVALSVPSVIVRQERNVVLNPLYPEFAQLQVARPVRFRFDERLVRVSGQPPAGGPLHPR